MNRRLRQLIAAIASLSLITSVFGGYPVQVARALQPPPGGAVLRLVGPAEPVTAGDSFGVDVYLDLRGTSELAGGADFSLVFDPSIIQYDERFDQGLFFSYVVSWDNSRGTLSGISYVEAEFIGEQMIYDNWMSDGEFNLITIYFRVQSTAPDTTTRIDFAETGNKVENPNLEDILSGTVGLAVEILGVIVEPTVLSGTWETAAHPFDFTGSSGSLASLSEFDAVFEYDCSSGPGTSIALCMSGVDFEVQFMDDAGNPLLSSWHAIMPQMDLSQDQVITDVLEDIRQVKFKINLWTNDYDSAIQPSVSEIRLAYTVNIAEEEEEEEIDTTPPINITLTILIEERPEHEAPGQHYIAQPEFILRLYQGLKQTGSDKTFLTDANNQATIAIEDGIVEVGKSYTPYVRTTRHLWAAGEPFEVVVGVGSYSVIFTDKLLAGDIVRDDVQGQKQSQINSLDFSQAVENYGPSSDFLLGDFNNDGTINTADLQYILNNWFEIFELPQ